MVIYTYIYMYIYKCKHDASRKQLFIVNDHHDTAYKSHLGASQYKDVLSVYDPQIKDKTDPWQSYL